MSTTTTNDGFTVVKKGKRRKPKRAPFQASAAGTPGAEDEPDEANVLRRVAEAEADLVGSAYVQNLQDVLFKSAAFCRDKDSPVRHVVCYGLGSFSRCVNARYQLALLICIRRYLSASSAVVYDPVFTALERRVLASLGFDVLEHNEEGKRCVNKRTLFFMPHCGTPLYNSLLWANWTKTSLNNILILGNSFDTIWTNKLDRVLDEKCSFLLSVKPAVREFAIVNNFRYADVFNDMSLHAFDGALLHDDVWLSKQEPFYGKDDEIVLALRNCQV
ncbi:unnamed protein product [Ixodes persulcatus]